MARTHVWWNTKGPRSTPKSELTTGSVRIKQVRSGIGHSWRMRQTLEAIGLAIFVLISDLYEGGVEHELLQRVGELLASGVAVIALLALSDKGAPAFDHALAARLAALGAPAFACTPDHFPELMAAAVDRRDIGRWAADRGIAVERAAG